MSDPRGRAPRRSWELRSDRYLLAYIAAFAATVVLTRTYLELTGYPQLGTGELHIAHAVWGGLLLSIAVLLTVTVVDERAVRFGAVLGGAGTGLFMDEIGKFVTRTNDYFFAPALAMVYGLLLVTVLFYLQVRGRRQSTRDRAAALARGGIEIRGFVPLGLHRVLYWVIPILMASWLILVVGYVVILAQGHPALDPEILEWRVPLVVIQLVIGLLMAAALAAWLTRNQRLGLRFAIQGAALSLVGLQTLYFYLSQFAAVTATLVQLAILLILVAYRDSAVAGSRLEGPARQ